MPSEHKAILARVNLPILTCLLLLALAVPVRAGLTITRGGSARCIIVQQPGATLAESNSVRELAGTLEKITGATFQVQAAADVTGLDRAIIVGPGPVARELFPEVA